MSFSFAFLDKKSICFLLAISLLCPSSHAMNFVKYYLKHEYTKKTALPIIGTALIIGFGTNFYNKRTNAQTVEIEKIKAQTLKDTQIHDEKMAHENRIEAQKIREDQHKLQQTRLEQEHINCVKQEERARIHKQEQAIKNLEIKKTEYAQVTSLADLIARKDTSAGRFADLSLYNNLISSIENIKQNIIPHLPAEKLKDAAHCITERESLIAQLPKEKLAAQAEVQKALLYNEQKNEYERALQQKELERRTIETNSARRIKELEIRTHELEVQNREQQSHNHTLEAKAIAACKSETDALLARLEHKIEHKVDRELQKTEHARLALATSIETRLNKVVGTVTDLATSFQQLDSYTRSAQNRDEKTARAIETLRQEFAHIKTQITQANTAVLQKIQAVLDDSEGYWRQQKSHTGDITNRLFNVQKICGEIKQITSANTVSQAANTSPVKKSVKTSNTNSMPQEMSEKEETL